MLAVPSPKKAHVTWSAVSSPRARRLYAVWKAAPVATGIPSPMKAKPPSMLWGSENMCIDPPWPRQMPVDLPKSSAMTFFAGTPLDRACTWSRYVLQM